MVDDARLITLAQLAAKLGLPVRWLRDEADAGRIPCLRAGRKLRFSFHAVESALAERAAKGGAMPPNETPDCADASPLLLSIAQLSQVLGVSERTIWGWDAQGRLPAPIRMSERMIRWGRDEITRWVAAGCPTRDAWNRQEQRRKGAA